MSIAVVLLLAAGLSMDAFAVSVTNGMCRKMPRLKNALYSGLAFGFFQGLMPLIGSLCGRAFAGVIDKFGSIVALLILGFIGVKMIREALLKRGEAACAVEFSLKLLIIQAVATSIDALAAGVSLGVMGANIVTSVLIIALTTFIVSFLGVFIGERFGGLLKEKAEIFGGVILIFIGVKIFVENMGII